VDYHERRLPHWSPEGRCVFVTWRLYASWPKCGVGLRPAMTAGQRFAARDAEMDRAEYGPTWLKDARVAQVVADTLCTLADEWKIYDLYAWVIMSNHVHMLINPNKPLGYVMRTVKGITAGKANQLLGRSGPFWLNESYDHWIRSEDEFNRIVKYIERNPVKAGLAERVEDWRWSSAWQAGGPPHI
jgi:REP element-mobilizing transposase RayT